MLVGLISDTHGVFDNVAAAALKGAGLVLHAGDVGHHGGHTEVLKAYADASAAPMLAVSGNVDDVTLASQQLLPPHRVVDCCGWKLLLTHVVSPGPASKVDTAAATLIRQHQPDVVVFGHSHKAAHWQAEGITYINPGSAGPARFKLKRTVATLWLPPRTGPSTPLHLTVHWGCSPAAPDALKHQDAVCGTAGGAAKPSTSAEGGHEPMTTQRPLSRNDAVSAEGSGGAEQVAAPAERQQHVGGSSRQCVEHCGVEQQPPQQRAWLCFHELPQKAPSRLKKASKRVV